MYIFLCKVCIDMPEDVPSPGRNIQHTRKGNNLNYNKPVFCYTEYVSTTWSSELWHRAIRSEWQHCEWIHRYLLQL
jgi:hypothetical protein